MPAATETRKITINVDAGQSQQQLKAIADSLSGMNQNTKSLADSFGFLKTIAGTFLGGLGVQQLISFSDQIQTLNNRLLALTGDQETATDLMHQLQVAARDTNSSLADTSELFTRMSLSLKDANIDSSVMIELTKTLVNTFRLSGSSAEEAAGKVTSLAYAMQQGGLRGRELRTILRENTELGNILKSTFNGNLLQAANNGFITTAKLIQVLHDNMGDVNERASQLDATIGQSLTKAFDAFKVKVFELNQSLGVSGGLSQAVDVFVKNMGTAITVGAVLAASTLPAIISGVVKLTASLTTLSLSSAGILTGGLAIGLAAVVAAFGNSSDIGDVVNQLAVGFAKLQGNIDDAIAKVYELLVSFHSLIGDSAQGFDKLALAARQSAKDHYTHAQALEIEYEAAKALAEENAKGAASTKKWADGIAGASKIKFDETPFQMLAKLNAEFDSGAISISEYNEKIQQVDLKKMRKEFETGHADLEKLNEATDKFNLYQLNTQLRDATITFQQFDDAVNNINLDKLNRQLAAGSISLEQYNSKLASVSAKYSSSGAFRTGLQDYLTSIGTTTQQVAGLITNTFKNVEDAFVTFTKTGKFNFDQFAQSILDDLERIIIRATIIAPLARGILGGISYASSTPADSAGQSYSDFSTTAAHGKVFAGGLKRFASGGVVSTPTMFGYGGGQSGLMGEAGPEAIIPLKRGSGGDLGVKASITPVTVNIINNNGSEVTQSQSTGPNGDKQIDIMITAKVREGFAMGKYDKQMKTSFGLNRKGS